MADVRKKIPNESEKMRFDHTIQKSRGTGGSKWQEKKEGIEQHRKHWIIKMAIRCLRAIQISSIKF